MQKMQTAILQDWYQKKELFLDIEMRSLEIKKQQRIILMCCFLHQGFDVGKTF